MRAWNLLLLGPIPRCSTREPKDALQCQSTAGPRRSVGIVPAKRNPKKDEPVSLAPLDFDEALLALMQIDPSTLNVEPAETDDVPRSDRPED